MTTVSVTALLLSDGATHCAHSQVAVLDVSSVYQQALSYAKQGQQYLNELAQLQTQLNSYAQLVRSGVTLPVSIWTSVQADISQVRNIANAASLLTGNSGTLLSRLANAQGYINQVGFLPQNIGNQFTMYQQTLGNAATQLGRVLGIQQQQEATYTSQQAAIQIHSQTAAGQMQAIQSTNEQLGLVNTQLQQVQTTLVASAQEIATRDEIAADRQAAQDQQYVQFLANPDLSMTGWKRYP